MARDVLVTKSNYLIEASYKLSLNEQRLVLCAIAQLDGRKPLSPDKNKITVTALEFAETFDMPLKQAYEAMEMAADRLYERDIRTADPKNKQRERFRWVSSVKYWESEAKVTLGFSVEILPYLTKLHRQFTSYALKQVANLSSAYAIRLYEFLVQFKSTGERYITVEDFRDSLELSDKYPVFADLRRRVIDPSVEMINVSTNLKVTWEPMKTGKAITAMKFSFTEEPQKKLKFEP